MKYISKIVKGGEDLFIKDAEARSAISSLQTSVTNGSHFIGKLKTDTEVVGAVKTLSDGVPANGTILLETTLGVYTSATPAEGQIALESGDMVIVPGTGVNASAPKEFIWDGAKFQELGSTGSLKDLAFKDGATGSYTPAGTNQSSSVSFSGTADDDFVTGYNNDYTAPSKAADTFSAGSLPSKVADTFSAGSLPSLGSASTGSFNTDAEKSTYDETNETLTLSAATTGTAVTAQGTFSAGSLPSFTEGAFSAGSLPTFTEGAFSAGSPATLATAKAITDLGTATAAAQTFTGTAATISVA